ncbi:MAG: hypothetical protein WCT77_14650 [Bacteroidota bacterium]
MNEDLQNKPVDYVVSSAKGILGAIPVFGPLVAELVGNVIPNQRIDRLVKFFQILGNKLQHLEKEFVEYKMKNELFIDLLEDCLWASTRALTDERKEYIANLFVQGLKAEKGELLNHKKLLQILNQIDEIDLLILIFLVNKYNKKIDVAEDYRQKIYSVLDPENPNSKELIYTRQKFLDSLGLVVAINMTDETEDEILFSKPRALAIMLLNEINNYGK